MVLFVCQVGLYVCNVYITYFQTVRTFGGLDILVSNAAVNPSYGSTLDVSQDLLSVCSNLYMCVHLQTESSAWDKVCSLINTHV